MRQKLARSISSPVNTDSINTDSAQLPKSEIDVLRAQRAKFEKAESAYRTISEVSEELSVPQHVLRFWETKFTVIKPIKRGGGRRYYKPEDIQLLKTVQRLLYEQGYTIKGVQRMISEKGVKFIDQLAGGKNYSRGPSLSDKQFAANAIQENEDNNMSDVDSLKEVLGELKELKSKLSKIFQS